MSEAENESESIRTSAQQSDLTQGIAAEASGQLRDYINNHNASEKSGQLDSYRNGLENDFRNTIENSAFAPFPLTDKERSQAVDRMNQSLESMVKGDLPDLRKRLQAHGLPTDELDKMDKKLSQEVAEAKPLQEAILKGDVKAMQSLLKDMKPEQLEKVSELIQKNFDKMNIGLEVDFTDGKLILSRSNGDRAVAVSSDKLDVIGVNKDGSYDFNRHFRHEKPGKELQEMSDGALSGVLYQKSHKEDGFYPQLKKIPSDGAMHVPNERIDSSKGKEMYRSFPDVELIPDKDIRSQKMQRK